MLKKDKKRIKNKIKKNNKLLELLIIVSGFIFAAFGTTPVVIYQINNSSQLTSQIIPDYAKYLLGILLLAFVMLSVFAFSFTLDKKTLFNREIDLPVIWKGLNIIYVLISLFFSAALTSYFIFMKVLLPFGNTDPLYISACLMVFFLLFVFLTYSLCDEKIRAIKIIETTIFIFAIASTILTILYLMASINGLFVAETTGNIDTITTNDVETSNKSRNMSEIFPLITFYYSPVINQNNNYYVQNTPKASEKDVIKVRSEPYNVSEHQDELFG